MDYDFSDLVNDIVDYNTTYSPYEVYDNYDDFNGGDDAYLFTADDLNNSIEDIIASLETDIVESNNPDQIREARKLLRKVKKFASITPIESSCDLFCEDDSIFTRDDIAEYVEEILTGKFPEILSCRGYIDKVNGKYLLSVDIVTEDMDLTDDNAPTVFIDLRKIRKPSDLRKYVTPIANAYEELAQSYNDYSDL